MKKYNELKVYSTNWCPDCYRAISFLEEFNLPYSKVDIEEHPEEAQVLEEKTGKRAIPYFVLDGDWIKPYIPGRGFKREEMRKLFGV